MSISLKTSLKLSQQLRMTPQLQQAIKLLQLSRLELENAVRRELDENPVLEEAQDLAEAEGPQLEAPSTSDESPEAAFDAAKADVQDPRKQDEFDWENYVDSQYKPPSGALGGSEEILNYENMISAKQTLTDHLMWQVNLTGFSEEEQNILSILISYVDDDGYIKTPIVEIAADEGLEPAQLEEMLPFLQEMDPPGVGARDLQECLLIQAKHLQEDTNDLVAIIKEHLRELEKKNYRGIAKAMNLPVEDVIELCKIIYEMDPKPGRAFVPQDTQFVTPDVYVYKVGDQYMVSLNEDGLPKLRVSNLYKNILAQDPQLHATMPKATAPAVDAASAEGSAPPPAAPASTQDYIQEKLKSAIWLIKSIHQRQRTIYKVTESIVRHQQEFFDKGPGHIRPMILRDIAADIGMHESTVSRVTTNKYVHTPQGIFELKYFFNSGISTSDGDALASESVKLKIKDMIGGEDVRHPLSDQKIVEILKKEGIQIARRTVAKYRDILRILPSSRRKKMF